MRDYKAIINRLRKKGVLSSYTESDMQQKVDEIIQQRIEAERQLKERIAELKASNIQINFDELRKKALM